MILELLIVVALFVFLVGWIIKVKGIWKVYAWFAGVLSFLSMIFLPFDSSTRTFPVERQVVEEIILALFIIAIFAYAYGKRIFKAYVWKVFVLVLIVDDVYGAIDLVNAHRHDLAFWLAMIVQSAFWIVNIIAVYLYSFKFFSEPKARTYKGKVLGKSRSP